MTPIAPGWALGADARQWILYQVTPDGKAYPIHFIATHKRHIERLVREEGIALSAEGRDVIDALPDKFQTKKKPQGRMLSGSAKGLTGDAK